MVNTFEAFFEIERSRPFGPTSYRAGYRCNKTGNAVCALELPASIVETTVLRDARLSAAVGPDGHVRFILYRVDCENMAEGVPSVSEPIDQLIARIVSVDSLHLEEISSADLSSLLVRLRRSVASVQEALRHLPDQHLQDTP